MDHRDPIASLDRSAAFLGRLVEAWARAAEGRLLEQSISSPGRINPDYLRQVDLASQILWRLAAVRKTLVLIEQHLDAPPSPIDPAQFDDEPAEPAPPASPDAPVAPLPVPDSAPHPRGLSDRSTLAGCQLSGTSNPLENFQISPLDASRRPARNPADFAEETDSDPINPINASPAAPLPGGVRACPAVPTIPTLLIDLDDTESAIRNARWAHHRLTRMGELPPLPPGSLGPSAPVLPPRAADDFRFDCERQFPDLYPYPYPPAPHPDPDP